jgi:hypothetical protein
MLQVGATIDAERHELLSSALRGLTQHLEEKAP